MLAALGLSEEEDSVYRYLAGALSATGDELRAALGLSQGRALAALANLVEHGFAYPLPGGDGDPARFAAAPPEAITELIAQRIGELYRARESLGALASRYHVRRRGLTGDGPFEVIHGAGELRERMLGLLRSARSEICNVVKPPLVVTSFADQARPGDGVRCRLLYETSMLSSPGALEAIRRSRPVLDEVRTHAKPPPKMVIADRATVLLPLAQQDSTPVGVLIREGAVLDSLLVLFDYVWSAAVPLRPHEDGGSAGPDMLSSADRHLLSLLLSGLTDEAIAVHLHVSDRTVQRRVRSLMDAANVRTRMQLAWEAARQGWV